MRYLTKPHPIFGSFAAAAISLLPVLAMAVVEINAVPSGVVDAGQNDDAGLRGAGLALAAAPFVYVIAVPVCYTVGMLLVSLGLRRLSGFLAGTVAIALILAIFAGLLIAAPSHFGVNDIVLSIAVCTVLLLITALPAALCWWFFAVSPHGG
jgi:hypothetical protein